MEMLTPTELKSILFSKRANIYYLEHCRVLQKDGRVLYLTEGKKAKQYWNIPIANTTCILLGTGTSVTQAAMRMLASAGVLVGFAGGGGTPLFAGTEIEWMSPQSEYRPTEYVQGWMSFWWDEEKRLMAAKSLQEDRCTYLENVWSRDRELQEAGFYADDLEVERALKTFRKGISEAENVGMLLAAEAHFAKGLYAYAAKKTAMSNFVRDVDAEKGEKDVNLANQFLNHGNYLAYGLAASTLWVLGIPHGFALMHGKTRRGALVFDAADLVKDTLILPWAFISASRGESASEFRQQAIERFTAYRALDYMYDVLKAHSMEKW
ncbi:type I-F CRISPR-associated endonuclease Cas1f [Selenomonas sp. TAMA-11512]|uniref:type I-F CRISPR-associated endonuclease Cas1f n=1 Tax=Selenomonas sp. TAMA-11512 TaxID=3095337 RepID=UPI00308BC8E7|nr:type I-F CRISPR-associated endonuclease Cas1f [Selenomonas sp. TAMA-11512]